MRAVCVALAFAALVPAAARGEPISITVASSTGGFSTSGMTLTTAALDLGTVTLPTVSSVGNVLISGLTWNSDVVVSFMLEGLGRFDTLKLEVLNPVGYERSDGVRRTRARIRPAIPARTTSTG